MTLQRFSCPHCDKRLKIDDPRAAGRTVTCPQCRTRVAVPASALPPPLPAPPPAPPPAPEPVAEEPEAPRSKQTFGDAVVSFLTGPDSDGRFALYSFVYITSLNLLLYLVGLGFSFAGRRADWFSFLVWLALIGPPTVALPGLVLLYGNQPGLVRLGRLLSWAVCFAQFLAGLLALIPSPFLLFSGEFILFLTYTALVLFYLGVGIVTCDFLDPNGHFDEPFEQAGAAGQLACLVVSLALLAGLVGLAHAVAYRWQPEATDLVPWLVGAGGVVLLVGVFATLRRVALRGQRRIFGMAWSSPSAPASPAPASPAPAPAPTPGVSQKGRLHVGMSLEAIIDLLGPPDSSATGADLLAGAGRVYGAPPSSLTGRAWYTWRRPEGVYTLTIQDGRLANIQNAPD